MKENPRENVVINVPINSSTYFSMKNHKKFFGATIVLSLFLLTGGYAITQSAEAKTPPPPIEEIKAARGAVIAGDYEAWAEAMENHPRAEEIVNEETFNKLLEAYALKEAGDFAGAKEIMEELGLRQDIRPYKGYIIEQFQLARQAVADENYEAWAEIANQLPNADEVVNEDVFATLVEAYQLREAGDYQEARELIKQLAEEYNLPVPPFHGWRMNAQAK